MRVDTLKRTRKEKFALALLAVAICGALYQPATGLAQSEQKYSILTKKLPTEAYGRVKSVSRFAADSHDIMNTDGTRILLGNRALADSSTFPLRFFAQLNRHPWRASPVMPVQDRDLSCYYGIPPYRDPIAYDTKTAPITVEANDVSGDLKDRSDDLIYTGSVIITQGDKVILTDVARYHGKEQTFTTKGSSVLQAPNYTVSTLDDVQTDLNSKVVVLKNSSFQMNGSVLRGSSSSHTINDNEGTQELKDGLLTSCPVNDSSWHMEATTIKIKKGETFGEAWNPSLWIGPIPVYYFPYLYFPLTNDRQTGFLYPSLSLGSNGGISVPFYFNIAPNYDWTITPEWTGKHGWFFKNEVRFMPFSNVSGFINYNYLPDDKDWDTAPSRNDRSRWFFKFYTHAWFLNHDLNLFADYSRVRTGDYDYLDDLGQKGVAVTDDNIRQTLKATYDQPKWDLSAEIRSYTTMLPPQTMARTPFSLLPQLRANYYDNLGAMSYKLFGEVTKFDRPQKRGYESYSATRVHLEPSFNYHLLDFRGTTINAGGRLFLTHYNQSNLTTASELSYLGVKSIDRSKNRALYELEISGKTTFERKVIDMRHTQTLEPEIKYMYIPYKDQSHIALYDTTDRMDDFYSLFSYRRYAGLDRIADVNALTMGFTTRLLNSHDQEIVRIGLAQAYSFVKTRVKLNITDTLNEYPRSPLALTFDARPLDNVTMHAAVSYDTDNGKFNSYNTSVRYNGGGLLAGLSYRFAKNANYSFEALKSGKGLVKEDLKQIGAELSIPLSADWRISAAYYRDLRQKYNIDRKIGLRYESCCYSVSIGYEEYMKFDSSAVKIKQDRVFGVMFNFKGFMGLNIKDMNNISTNTHFLPSVDEVNLNR